jgi:hypothetical protein
MGMWLDFRSSMLSIVACTLFGVNATPQQSPPKEQTVDVSWKTFANKAGWTIQHPGNWKVGSCRQCSDPTDPNVFVTISNPLTKELIMIERLIDKPGDQTVEQWLNNVKVSTDLNPIISQEWISLSGTQALKVVSRESENIYVVRGSKTFAIRADPKTFSHPPGQRILSSFRFSRL